MNAQRKEGAGMMEIRTEVSATEPNYRKTAAELLKRCREFYEDPENEKAFQEWKEQQKKAPARQR